MNLPPDACPRLLLLEDDPTSQAFLRDALEALPAQVDAAADIAGAVALARENVHALWLVDAHLPDGDGADALRALRAIAPTPALAVTAGAARDELDALVQAGYLEVLPKPVPVALLQATVQRLLGAPAAGALRVAEPGKLPIWDEQQALAALGGNRESLLALRGLFLAELPAARTLVESAIAAGDAEAARAALHKLQAGAGFVGAARLARAVRALSNAPMDGGALESFSWAVEDLELSGA